MGDKLTNAYDKETAFTVLEIVNTWIISADNKASILLAFIGIIVGLSSNALTGIITNIKNVDILLIVTLVVYLVMLLITLLQIVLVFSAKVLLVDKIEPNLISYISISQNRELFINEAINVTESELLKMILSQISVNSRIAVHKMKYFNTALKFAIPLVPLTFMLLVFSN
jgi:hypothetical protein